ncbi:S-layer homology domain-containing protein [Paenibacillus sp. JDR-2]|uniref:S-layer homology domain-containing protein n=1 Tax=Paenibacillus sp. (strain JDR-2) TaxID=324057 RepID=UPI000166A4B5|nr:S-layer homology domain-containing protein [Paenibacillus sp. JDR-2]ACT00656.1 S-layer domain protein [Paenibacillus sp. JDR-2]
MRKKSYLLSLIFLMCFVYVPPMVTYADAAPSFTLNVTSTKVELGNELLITVTGNDLRDVYGYEFSLSFDQTMLEYKGAQSGISSGFSIKPMLEGNQLRFASTKLHKVAGESGALTLATLTFKTIRQGTATLQLKSVQTVDSQLTGHMYLPDTKVSATITSGNSGESGSGGTGTVVNPPMDQSSAGKLNPDVKMNASTKIATATVNQAVWDKAIMQIAANEDGAKSIEVIIKALSGATAYELELPTSAFASNGGLVQIKVTSPLGTIMITNKMFEAGVITADSIRLRIGKADASELDQALGKQIGDRPIREISLYTGDQKIAWNNPNSTITVAVPYSPSADELKSPEHIVVWYLNEEGKKVPVPNGRYDADANAVIFSTTHLSKYAIAFVQKTFDDIAALDWAKKQIEVLASKGIINGISDKAFAPRQSVTRADFLVLLVRTLEIDVRKGSGSEFADVKESDYYHDAVTIARGLGITEGAGNNKFLPQEPITREDMIVLTERTLRAVKQLTTDSNEEQLSQFEDHGKIANYAVQSVAAMVRMGLVHGVDGAIDPKGTTDRAQAAVLMYNIYSRLYE